MKLVGTVLLTFTHASHFRAGSFQLTPNGGNVDIKRTHGWRRGSDGYDSGCDLTDVTNQVVSGDLGSEVCKTTSGASCGQVTATYIVTDIEDTISPSNQYCYGYNDDQIVAPTEAYSYQYDGCCWVAFTDDAGTVFSGGAFRLTATMSDLVNTSPDVKLPPVWYIMSGCSAQSIDLNPTDADGDITRCRWSTFDEAQGGMYDASLYPSLTLDTVNCIVTYDGTLDATKTGVKPISVHVEDVDANGNVRSAVPVQFLATVWTPGVHPKSQNGIYPNWFGDHDHTDEIVESQLHEIIQAQSIRTRGRRAEPTYCSEVPFWTGVTPTAGSEIQCIGGAVQFVVHADSANSSIGKINFSKPIGMTCSAPDTDGKATCSWQASAQQRLTQTHQVCFQANDQLGLQTEYRCITLKMVPNTTTTTTTTTTTPKIEVTNIHEMADEFLAGTDISGNPTFTKTDAINYGCTGRNNFDAFSPILGKPKDEADKAFYKWKKCIQCATSKYGTIAPYNFDESGLICLDHPKSIERSVCECDFQLVSRLNTLEPNFSNQNLSSTECQRSAKSGNGACCENQKSGLFQFYNSNSFCCNSIGQVHHNGNC